MGLGSFCQRIVKLFVDPAVSAKKKEIRYSIDDGKTWVDTSSLKVFIKYYSEDKPADLTLSFELTDRSGQS